MRPQIPVQRYGPEREVPMRDKKELIRFATSYDRRVGTASNAPTPLITLPATAAESATNVDTTSSPSRPLMAPATRVLIEQFGAFALYADWLPVPSDVNPPTCAAKRNQLLVRMAHPDVLEPPFADQLADALETAGIGRAMTAYFLPVIRSAVKRGPNR